MADDENGTKTGSAEPAAPHPDAKPVAVDLGPTTGPVAPSDARPTEWTASDARGPLNEAGPGTQRLYPPNMDTPPEAGGSIEEPAAGAEPVSPAPATPAIEPVGSSAIAQPKRSFWPVAAGVVVGAIIGAGSAAVIYGSMGGGTDVGPSITALSTRVDALEKRPDASQTLAPLKTSITALDGKVADLNGRLTSLENKPAATAPAVANAAPAFDPAPLQQKIATQQQQLDALQKQGADAKTLETKIAALDADLKGLGTQTASAQASITVLQGGQKSLEGKITSAPALAVVADSLVQQINLGRPYAAQVNALSSLGADPVAVAVLRQNADKGVPSAKELATKFEPLAEPIAATEHRPPPNAGFVDRLKSGMFSMVSIRRADDVGGDDLASRVARIQASLAHDDVGGALDAWSALPAEAKAKSDAWGALAKTHAEAMKAAQGLRQQAIAALGKKS